MNDTILTLRDRAIMLALVAIAEPITNPQLRQRYRLDLVGESRRRLERARLVTSTPHGRTRLFEVGEEGWAWAIAELESAPPDRADSGLRALYAVLNSVSRHLKATDSALADVFVPAEVTRGLQDVGVRVLSGYADVATEPGVEWISMADLREQLADVSRIELDTSIIDLVRAGKVVLAPEAAQSRLTDREREAALSTGGSDKHLLIVR